MSGDLRKGETLRKSSEEDRNDLGEGKVWISTRTVLENETPSALHFVWPSGISSSVVFNARREPRREKQRMLKLKTKGKKHAFSKQNLGLSVPSNEKSVYEAILFIDEASRRSRHRGINFAIKSHTLSILRRNCIRFAIRFVYVYTITIWSIQGKNNCIYRVIRSTISIINKKEKMKK